MRTRADRNLITHQNVYYESIRYTANCFMPINFINRLITLYVKLINLRTTLNSVEIIGAWPTISRRPYYLFLVDQQSEDRQKKRFLHKFTCLSNNCHIIFQCIMCEYLYSQQILHFATKFLLSIEFKELSKETPLYFKTVLFVTICSQPQNSLPTLNYALCITK